MLLSQYIQVPLEVRPAPLLRAKIPVVAPVEVGNQRRSEPFTKYLFCDFMATALVPVKVSLPCCGEAPEVSVQSILSPARFISMRYRTTSDSLKYLLCLSLPKVRYFVQYLADLT